MGSGMCHVSMSNQLFMLQVHYPLLGRLLILHDEISEEKTLEGLAATFSINSDRFES